MPIRTHFEKYFWRILMKANEGLWAEIDSSGHYLFGEKNQK